MQKHIKLICFILLIYSCEKTELIQLDEKTTTEKGNFSIKSSQSKNFSMTNTVVMDANYNNGLENSGYSEIGANIPSSSRRSVDFNIPRTGSHSIKHKLYITDPEDPIAGSMRAESHNVDLISARITPGQTRYYGLSIYIPSSWVTDGIYDDILFQWKGFNGAPFMFITQKHDDIILRYNYNTNPDPNSGTIIKKSKVLAPLTKGRWHDFRFRVVWQYADNGLGRIEVDHKLDTDTNYVRVFNYIGPNMFNKDGYLKWGIYKPAWDKNQVNNYTGSVTQRIVWHDNVRVGSSWQEIDPSL